MPSVESCPIIEGPRPKTAREKKMHKYLEREGVPGWYRGISTIQMDAASNIFNSLRDDFQQHSTHRVLRSLSLLGLEPLITSKQAALLMSLSRGNDLAFLWFVMEMHYKSNPNKSGFQSYNLNEQIIMSSIAHLDMIPTLRELDRILPPGHSKRKKSIKQAPSTRRKTIKRRIVDYPSPYLAPLPMAKPISVDLCSEEPDLVVNLDIYEKYVNPDFTMAGESNQWYANYELNANRRVAYRIIREILNEIFDDFIGMSQKYSEERILCETHKEKEAEEEAAKKALRIKRWLEKKERCLELADVNKKPAEARLLRILTMIEEEIKRFENRKKFENFRRTEIKDGFVRVIVMKGDNECECYIAIEDDEKTHTPSVQSTQGAEIENNLDITCSEMERIDTEQSSSKIFFQGTTEKAPYKFNYQKIFKLKKTDSEELKEKIQQFCIEALTETSEFSRESLTPFLPYKCIGRQSTPLKAEMSAVDVPKPPAKRKKKFKDAIAEYVDTYCKKKAQEPEIQPSEETSTVLNIFETDPKYNRSYFNPDDHQLMTDMLKDALKIMAQNPKFVLASMPESYKFPVLREWIRRRYGKAYTKAERIESLTLSTMIFQMLSQMERQPSFSLAKHGLYGQASYKCTDYLKQMKQRIVKEYTDTLNDQLMKDTRILWFAMRPSLCQDPANTFFSYMPANIKGITRFRPYKGILK